MSPVVGPTPPAGNINNNKEGEEERGGKAVRGKIVIMGGAEREEAATGPRPTGFSD